MAIHCVRPDISGEFRNPFDCDELIVKALVTVSAFVALADGQLRAIERDEAVNYIERQQLGPTISRGRIAEFFDAAADRRLDPNEVQVVSLIRLISMPPARPKAVNADTPPVYRGD